LTLLAATLAATATSLVQTTLSNSTVIHAAAPAAEKQWFAVAAPAGVTVAVGIGFANPNVGYFAGGANGAGTEILKTEDGGESWNVIPGIKFGLDILLLGAEAAKNTVVVTSIFGELYSINGGKNWSKSIGGGLSQSVRYIGEIGKGNGLQFGIVGVHGGKQGCALTNNAGITFKSYPAEPTLFTAARYGVYPDSNNWLIGAGTFPAAPPSPPTQARLKGGYRKYLHQDDDGKWLPVKTILANSLAAEKAPVPTGWSAQIVKTSDAGKTWTSEFEANNTFYFNEIDCAPGNNKHCCAVAEDSNNAYVYCSTDGGPWTAAWTGTGTPGKKVYTMMGLEFVTSTEAWACGGTIGVPVRPVFLHSLDGGKTWAEEAANNDLLGNICLALDMLGGSADVGYAAMDNVGRQQASVAKYSSGKAPPPPPPPAPPSPAPPGKTHYEDPNANGGKCLSDEEAIQITGLDGSFCSPNCGATSPCPTDVPTGTTAQPKCVLDAPGSQSPTNCALICKPGDLDNQCPTNASCKAIQGTGLCTYDN